MATDTRSRSKRQNPSDCRKQKTRLDREWKSDRLYVIAVMFRNGIEKGMVFLYGSVREARRDAKLWAQDPLGDGIVSARVRRVQLMKLADVN